MNFNELNIIQPLLKALEKQDFSTPTEVQEKVIPLAIKGKDILASAQTGSGKTLAFAIPILQNLYTKRLEQSSMKEVPTTQKRIIKALIIAPTRELVMQIGEVFAPYCTNVNMKYTTIFGGVNQFHQVKAIEKGVDILIATPGRLEDLISQGIIKLSYVEILTLDEADRMLNLGFLPDIKKVMKRVPKERQTLFFSATMPKEIKEFASSLLHCQEEITVKKVVSNKKELIKQQVYHVKTSHRRQLLQYLVKNKEFDSIIIFVKTKDESEFILAYVKSAGIKCDSINKNKSQNARQKALKDLKDGEIKVLVATDIASRGLDVENLSCVINYNVPSDPEDYIHRIGRTARAGKKGVAITFCIEHSKDDLAKIEKLTGQKLEEIQDKAYLDEVIPKGKILGYDNFDEEGKKKLLDKKRKEKRVFTKKDNKLENKKVDMFGQNISTKSEKKGKINNFSNKFEDKTKKSNTINKKTTPKNKKILDKKPKNESKGFRKNNKS